MIPSHLIFLVYVKQNDIGEELFFIMQGKVDVIKNEKIIATLGEGFFFGEISLVMENSRRTASVFTRTSVDVFVLNKTHLDEVFEK